MNTYGQWVLSKESIGGHPALKHKITEELCLFGARGQIFERAPGEYTALVYLPSGEEKAYYFHRQCDLNKWVKSLQVPGRGQKELVR